MEIPSKIGKYKILKKLGEGASGCVVKAEQEVIQRIVALKILFSSLLEEKPLIIKRFHREARLASALVHPNIVPIFEIDECNKMHYYTMQYIEGIPMIDYIKSNSIPIETRVDIFIELCDALALAHSRTIIHRDMKPHNVIITKEMHPVILDFGIAKSLIEEEQMTQVGHILGSAHYMAPEQAGPGNVGTYTDIFAVGVMLYEMMTGQRPFQGNNVKDLIMKRIQYAQKPDLLRPPSMKEINHEIPETLDSIVFRCLEANPKNRYQTAGDLLKALQQFRSEFCLTQTLDSEQNPSFLSVTVNKKASYFYPCLLSILLFILMISFSFWVYYGKQEFLSKAKGLQDIGSNKIQEVVKKITKK